MIASPKVITLNELTDICHALSRWTSLYSVVKIGKTRVHVQCKRGDVVWILVLPAYISQETVRVVIDPLRLVINQVNAETNVFDELLNWRAER